MADGLGLEEAWTWRETRGLLAASEALRIFHGPGEARGAVAARLAIDRFGDHYWITEWEQGEEAPTAGSDRTRKIVEAFLRMKGAVSAVALSRPTQGVPSVPEVLFGTAPAERFTVSERGARYGIRLLNVRHPGLFLDHAPLRDWLRAHCRDWSVLNCFAYTGSLSVAAALGGAAHVTTLDLAKPVIRWAEENWALNELPAERARFIAGDVFEWLPRLKREGKRFDCVVLDPPSFSHGTKGRFSTTKDLPKLHELALDVLKPGGTLVTSINSANVSWARFEADILAAASARGVSFEVLARIDQPETFPTRLGASTDRYLKGFILRGRSLPT